MTVVIGAGHAGLAVATALRRVGENVVVIERGDSVATSWRGRHDSLRLNTERWLSHLPGEPIPRHYGTWVARDDLISYLEHYAELNELDISFGTAARRIARKPHGWAVETDQGTLEAKRVVLATGLHRFPRLPAWHGIAEFRRELIHSSEYVSPDSYRDLSVLVVGAGVSGAEIATELAHRGARTVTLSMRAAPYVVKERVLGLVRPGALATIAENVPSTVLDPLVGAVNRMTRRTVSVPGLDPPRDFSRRVFDLGRMPVLDRGFLAAVKEGRISLAAAVERFQRDEVVLADGSRLAPDAVIAATGYLPDLEPLVGHLGVLGIDGRPVFHGGEEAAPGLHFVGFRYALAGQFREARRAAAALARRTKAYS